MFKFRHQSLRYNCNFLLFSILLSILIFLPENSEAQFLPNEPDMVYYTNNPAIYNFTNDNDNLWISTVNGLYLMNKTTGSIKPYYTCNSGLPTNTIRCVAIEKNGVKWFGTSRGLTQFDGKNWMVYNSFNSPIPKADIVKIVADEQANKWILTSSLIKFDGTNWKTYNYSFVDACIGKDGKKWFITNVGKLYSFDDTDWINLNKTNSGLPSDTVYTVITDAKGVMWFGTGKGVAKYDGVKWTIFPINIYNTSDAVSALSVDNDGAIWAINRNGDLLYFKGMWTKVTTENSNLPSNKIITLSIDAQGNKWFATADGKVVRYKDTDWRIFETNTILPDNNISAVAVQNDVKWIGTANKQVASFDGKVKEVFNAINSSVNEEVKNILVDKNNALWFYSTYNLFQIDNGQWKIYNSKNNSYLGLIYDVAYDIDNSVWVATHFGVTHFDGTKWVNYDLVSLGFKSSVIYAIAIDNIGNKWIGTSDGFYKFDGNTWTKLVVTLNSLLPDNITQIAIDSKGRVWVLTVWDELALYDGTSWLRYKPYNFNLTGISGFSIDLNNNLWLFYGNQLAKFDEKTTKSYDLKVTTTINDITIDDKGNIWLATTTGLIAFNEGSMKMDIKGSVNTIERAAVSSGNVYLFNNTRLYGGYDTVAITNIKPTGEFIFENTANCSYTLFAEPDKAIHPNLLPAYLGDTLVWMGADTLVAQTSVVADTIICKPKPTAVQQGTASINGEVIINLDNKKSKKPGKNIGVVAKRKAAKRSDGEQLYYTTTDENGGFKFDNLPAGEYEIFIDHVGIPMYRLNDANVITISDNQKIQLTGLVDSAKVTLENIVVQISTLHSSLFTINSFPNPTTDKIYFQINTDKPRSLILTISDMLGKKVQEINLNEISTGSSTVEIDVSNLVRGMYLMEVWDKQRKQKLGVEKVNIN